MKYITIFLFLVACSRPQSAEKESDPFPTFLPNQEYEFLSGLGPDRIIMTLKRIEKETFSYRIELLRNYNGLPLDYGTVALTRVYRDNAIRLEGGNEHCQLTLLMSQSREPSSGKRIIIERTCSDTTWNIAGSDFAPLWRRGEPH